MNVKGTKKKNDVPLDFDEEELREYLHNHRKKITVNAIISIQVHEKPVGTVFEKGIN